MRTVLLIIVRWLLTSLRPRVSLQLEVFALRHQLSVYQRTCQRPQISPADWILWSYLARIWAGWREHLLFVKPDTVLSWQRTRFRDHWRRLSQAGQPGRPPVAKEVRDAVLRRAADPASFIGKAGFAGKARSPAPHQLTSIGPFSFITTPVRTIRRPYPEARRRPRVPG